LIKKIPGFRDSCLPPRLASVFPCVSLTGIAAASTNPRYRRLLAVDEIQSWKEPRLILGETSGGCP
jgi:hypothetical protein